MKTKYIFITGGVVSSVGKGVTAAAIGRLLKDRGFKVSVQKLDPYINVDPGTMSPYQHGEVYVLEDGAETDLDLGHYERFMDINLSRVCNITTGQVYAEVIGKERRGEYLGGTIQVIPHITNEIKYRIGLVTKSTGAEIVLVEVGGTVGDIESLPFLEALRQMRSDVGLTNTLYIHVTWLPVIGATGEIKTKPTQHSVRELRSIGISPQIIIARSDQPVENDLCEKIALFCDVDREAVIPMVTETMLYRVPLTLEEAGIADIVLKKLKLRARQKPDMAPWRRVVKMASDERPILHIALVGKYVELHDAYMSVREALKHAGLHLGVKVKIDWVNSADLENGKNDNAAWQAVENAHGIVVPGGFGHRGIEGKIRAAKFAREERVPYLGLCLGMQLMVVDHARSVLGFNDANSTEFDPKTTHPVIDLMPDQRHITDKGATMRLGVYPCRLQAGSQASKAYQKDEVNERHRHRYELNNEYRQQLSDSGMCFSGVSPDDRLVEIAEIPEHPFMLGTQFHPEFLSRPTRPHPLFTAFLKAVCAKAAIQYIEFDNDQNSEMNNKHQEIDM